MGEIRIVGPGKTRGYPYPVCKNKRSDSKVKLCLFAVTFEMLSSLPKFNTVTVKCAGAF